MSDNLRLEDLESSLKDAARSLFDGILPEEIKAKLLESLDLVFKKYTIKNAMNDGVVDGSKLYSMFLNLRGELILEMTKAHHNHHLYLEVSKLVATGGNKDETLN